MRPGNSGLPAYPTFPPVDSGPSTSSAFSPYAGYGAPNGPPRVQGYSASSAYVPGPPVPTQPPLAISSMGSESVTLVRIRMNDDYRIEPPIPVSAALVSGGAGAASGGVRPYSSTGDLPAQANGSGGAPALDRERALLAQTEQPPNPVTTFFERGEQVAWRTQDVATFVDMGFKPEHAALACAYVKEAKLTEADIPDFASNLGELAGMGFPLPVATGALVVKKNDKRAASELCLAVPTGP